MQLLNAAQFFALSQGDQCRGEQECHWCCAPCERLHVAADPIIAFVKNPHHPKRPGNQYICQGCWLYRRKSITVHYLSEGLKDRQCLINHSWWLTESSIHVIKDSDYALLYKRLLDPPLRFVLSLLDPDQPVVNHIHLARCNQLSQMSADSELFFTLNNVIHDYTIYELEQALQHGPEGKGPGVQALLRYLGPCPVVEDKRGKGRPNNEEKYGKSIRRKIR